jgi:hypothetical protein
LIVFDGAVCVVQPALSKDRAADRAIQRIGFEKTGATKKDARQGRQSGKKRALTRTKTKFSWRRNIQAGPFLVTLALLRRVDRE